MRKLYALLLTLCFGIIIPVAAQPLRVCLLDPAEQADDCCNKCQSEHADCCAELDQLPDSTLPGTGLEIPPFIAFELPFTGLGAPRELEIVSLAPHYTPPIRGPDSPSAFRSILSVWRL